MSPVGGAAARDEPDVLQRQVAAYRSEGYPAGAGLVWASVLLRRNTEAVRRFSRAWWDEYQAFSKRDQMSFNVVARRLGFTFALMPPPDRTNPHFRSLPHRNARL